MGLVGGFHVTQTSELYPALATTPLGGDGSNWNKQKIIVGTRKIVN